MTGDRGWHHYHSQAVISRGADADSRFARAKTALATYQFSDPAIVTAHFDPASALQWRRRLLEIKGSALSLPDGCQHRPRRG